MKKIILSIILIVPFLVNSQTDGILLDTISYPFDSINIDFDSIYLNPFQTNQYSVHQHISTGGYYSSPAPIIKDKKDSTEVLVTYIKQTKFPLNIFRKYRLVTKKGWKVTDMFGFGLAIYNNKGDKILRKFVIKVHEKNSLWGY